MSILDTRPAAAHLLRAILEAPDDDGVRLVYADAVEEAGNAAYSAFIRCQVELYRWERCKPCGAFMYSCYEFSEVCTCTDSKADALRERERELFARLDFGLPDPWGWGMYLKDAGEPHRDRHVVVRRGLVESVTLSAADALAHLDALSWSPEMTAECPQIRWRVLQGTVDAETRRRAKRDGLDGGPCPPWCEGGCKGTGRVPRPVPATAQPITEVRLTTPPEWEPVGPGAGCRLAGDPLRMAFTSADHEAAGVSGRFVSCLLRLRWPAVKTWHSPPPNATTATAAGRIEAGQLGYLTPDGRVTANPEGRP